jgi:hypothetical protein
VNRSPTTVDSYLDYFQAQILPAWKDVALDDIKAVGVEKWLRSLEDLAPGSKAKIRNHMSALFSHCIRHETGHQVESHRLCASERCEPA